jgi:hypothetical protein
MAFDLTIAKLKPLEDKLERIARALEEMVLREHHVNLRATPKPDGDDSDVLYTDDLSQFKQQLEDEVLRRRSFERTIDDEEDLG